MVSLNKNTWILVLVILFAVLAGLKATRLTADPPEKLSWSGGLFGDEPAYAHNARNKAVFNKWIMDEWNPYLYNPILTFCDFLSFKTFGSSFKTLRFVPLFWGILGMFFFFVILYKDSQSYPWAVLGLVFLEANFFFLMYTRLSLSDTMLTNWMIMALFFWILGKKNSTAMFLAGVSSVGVFSCKPTALYFMGVLLTAYLFYFFRKVLINLTPSTGFSRKTLYTVFKNILPFISGVVLAGGLWFILFYIPNHSEISRFSVRWKQLAMPKSLGDFTRHLFGSYAPITFKYFAWFPFIFLTGWLYLPISIYRLIRTPRKVSELEVLTILWVIIGYCAISGFRYRPTRYFISLVPPTVLLAWMACRWLYSELNEFKLNKLKKHAVFIFMYLWWVVLTIILAMKYISISRNELYMLTGLLLLAIITNILFYLRTNDRIKTKGLTVVIIIAVLSLGHNLNLYAKWVSSPTYEMIQTSRRVGKLVESGIIVGLWAPMICMENNNRALCIASRWFNDKNPYKRFHFTHVFLWRGNYDAELELLKKPLGIEFLRNNLKEICVFRIKGAKAQLFKVVDRKKTSSLEK